MLQNQSPDLIHLRWRNRVLLVFSDQASQSNAAQQRRFLDREPNGLKERDLLIFYLDTKSAPAHEWKAASGQFTAVLIGKDGTARHEVLHRDQYKLAALKNEGYRGFMESHAPEALREHPLFQKASRVLREEWNYPDKPGSHIAETAIWLGSGDFGGLGFTRNEAIEALSHYFDVLIDYHGKEAHSIIDGMIEHTSPSVRGNVRFATRNSLSKMAGRETRTE